MIGIVLVAHSRELANGLAGMLAQAAPNVTVRVAAGADGRGLGTSAPLVELALRAALADAGTDGVIVLLDLGSSAMALEIAMENLTAEERARLHATGASFVEGALLAAISAARGASIDEALAAAVDGSRMRKLPADWL